MSLPNEVLPVGVTRRSVLTTAAVLAGSLLGGISLKRRSRRGPLYLRPPGAGNEREFLSACFRCGQCVEACPTQILSLAGVSGGPALGTPFVAARRKPCNLCQGELQMECIAVCPTNALQSVSSRRDVRMGVAEIDRDLCLPWQDPPIACKACWHACPFPHEAITFDELGRALVVDDVCVGCGLCEHACLTAQPAIYVVPREQRSWDLVGSDSPRKSHG